MIVFQDNNGTNMVYNKTRAKKAKNQRDNNNSPPALSIERNVNTYAIILNVLTQ